MPDVELEYVVPSPDLRAHVTLFYHFRTPVDRFEDVERADHHQFRFHLSDGPATYHFPDATGCPAPRCHLLAAITGPRRVVVDGPVRVFGMGLTPAGWGALVDLDASAAYNTVLDGDALFGEAVAGVAAELTRCDTAAAMVSVAEAMLRPMLAREHGAILRFVAAVDDWLAGSVSPNVADLVALTGLSSRQVERRCNRLYGGPPKLLARKYRALRAAAAIAAGTDPSDPAIVEGFYDQSHMIREIKQFTGTTPRRMRASTGPLGQRSMAERRALGGRVHPNVSHT